MTERGVKYDETKPKYHLLPEHALEAVVRVLTYGANKYAERNWERGIRYSRLFSAAQRHLWAFWRGEDYDPESRLHHLAHAAASIMMLLETYEWDECEDLDDRPSTIMLKEGIRGADPRGEG